MTDDRPAFYALKPGGIRDWWTLLHPPYTLWHLSYVAIGAAAAPRFQLEVLGKSLAAFFLAMGIGAHALDELNGRPLRTRIPTLVLWIAAIASVTGAVVIGALNIGLVGLPGIPIICFGAFVVFAYNLEWFGGRFHSDRWFALAWGAFPALIGFWAQGAFRPLALVVASACYAMSRAQRTLSTPVRDMRRRTAHVTGTIERNDGSIEALDRGSLTASPEAALRAMSMAMPLFALAAAGSRAL